MNYKVDVLLFVNTWNTSKLIDENKKNVTVIQKY